MIDSREISVVVQGPIFYEVDKESGFTWTQKCVNSIRKILPGAEIVLSTWENSDITGIDFDECIFSKDPGKLEIKNFDPSNVNRQIVSTLNGIKKTHRKYVLKMRTESYLINADFINVFGLFEKRCEEYKIAKSRIIAMFYVNPFYTLLPFFLSDTYFFGLKEDLLNYWDVPLADEVSMFQALRDRDGHAEINLFERIQDWSLNSFPINNNSYYLCEYVKKYLSDNNISHKEKKESLITVANKVVANNFVLLDGWNSYGIMSLKYPEYSEERHRKEWVCFDEWKMLYKKYCDKNYSISKSSIYKFWASTLPHTIRISITTFIRLSMPHCYYVLMKMAKRIGLR